MAAVIASECGMQCKNRQIHNLDYEVNEVYLQAEQWVSITVKAAGPSLSSTNDIEMAMNELRDGKMLYQFFYNLKMGKKREPNITIIFI